MNSLYEHISETVRELRKVYGGEGLSQEELGKKLSVPANTISRWETGTYKPNAKELDNLARFFNVSISIFFPDSENIANPKRNALLSALGDLDDDEIDEVTRYAQFRIAHRRIKQDGKTKSDQKKGKSIAIP